MNAKKVVLETSNRNKLKELVDLLDEDQSDFIYKLITLMSNKFEATKSNLSELSGLETNKIDTAIPLNYVRLVQELHPNFDTFFHVYDYSENIYGEFKNVAEALVRKLIKILE